jgi:hypothetical protein
MRTLSEVREILKNDMKKRDQFDAATSEARHLGLQIKEYLLQSFRASKSQSPTKRQNPSPLEVYFIQRAFLPIMIQMFKKNRIEARALFSIRPLLMCFVRRREIQIFPQSQLRCPPPHPMDLSRLPRARLSLPPPQLRK